MERGVKEWEISTYNPLGDTSGRAVFPRFMENHNFGFGGDGQSIVLTPRLGGLHHGQELGNGGGDQTKVVDVQEDDHEREDIWWRHSGVREVPSYGGDKVGDVEAPEKWGQTATLSESLKNFNVGVVGSVSL
jgi:hypothetical protein